MYATGENRDGHAFFGPGVGKEVLECLDDGREAASDSSEEDSSDGE